MPLITSARMSHTSTVQMTVATHTENKDAHCLAPDSLQQPWGTESQLLSSVLLHWWGKLLCIQ